MVEIAWPVLKPFYKKILKFRFRKKDLSTRLKWVDQGLKKLNHIDSEGNSIAHRAVIENREDVLKKFKGKGLRLDGRNNQGLTPLDLCHYLNPSLAHYFGYKQETTVQIYRNKDSSMHTIPIKELEQKLDFSFVERPQFTSYKDFKLMSKRGEGSLNFKLAQQMNQWMLACYGKALEARPDKSSLYIRYIDSDLGYGIFAAKPIHALSLVGEYTGKVMLRRKRERSPNDYIFDYSAGHSNTRFVIDASHQGNLTRFINHSNNPNLLSRWVVRDGICHIIFFAKKKIAAHEQITYDYGDYFWRRRKTPKVL